MTKADLHQLVDELADEAVESTAVLLERIRLHQFDPNQAWVWSEQCSNSSAARSLTLPRGGRSGSTTATTF